MFRAQLAAVPDHSRLGAACRRLGREPLDRDAALLREWPLRVHVRTDRVTVMNEEKSQLQGLRSQVLFTSEFRLQT